MVPIASKKTKRLHPVFRVQCKWLNSSAIEASFLQVTIANLNPSREMLALEKVM